MIIFIEKNKEGKDKVNIFGDAVVLINTVDFILKGKKRTVNTVRRLLNAGYFENEDYILYKTKVKKSKKNFDFKELDCTFEEIN